MTSLKCLILLTCVLAWASQTAADEGETAPLFTSHELVEVTIRGPFSTIMRVRSLDEDSPGTLTYNDPEAGAITVDVGIRTRGRFRHQKDVCPWAPLRLNFKKSEVEGTLFESSDKMKLVTHCRNGSRPNEQALQKEYMAYRIFNEVTDNSFRVRMLRVTYTDTDRNDRERVAYAFLIEHRDQLADRIGVKVNDVEETEIGMLDPVQTNLGSLFEYLIANTDFSPIRAAPGEPCCHNNVLFGDEEGAILAIPYDFDMSGIVSAPYATPNPRFGLRNVRQRLYRGRCVNNEYLDGSIQTFADQKQAIFDVVANNEWTDNSTRKKTTRFIDDFYKTIEDPKRVQEYLVKKCL